MVANTRNCLALCYEGWIARQEDVKDVVPSSGGCDNLFQGTVGCQIQIYFTDLLWVLIPGNSKIFPVYVRQVPVPSNPELAVGVVQPQVGYLFSYGFIC